MTKILVCKPMVVVIIIVVFVLLFFIIKNNPSVSRIAEQENQEYVIPGPEDGNITASTTKPLFKYIEVTKGCGPHFSGVCVNMRSGPGLNYPVVAQLRTGVVLKVEDMVLRGGREWYKIKIDEKIYYPERVKGGWFVASGDFVQLFLDEGDKELASTTKSLKNKRIVVDVSKQKLYAYDGSVLFMQEKVSTGLELTSTPKGKFTIYKKTPSRYMQGPIPGVNTSQDINQYYDLPGVPWDLYFTKGGAVIHGAYWHDNFGEPWSHGCVNLSPENAKKLYLWADVGTPVIVEK